MNNHYSNEKKIGFFYPIIFPFFEKGWINKIWWLCVVAYVPILDFIVLSGWKLEVVRRYTLKLDAILPEIKIGKYLKDGLYLTLAKIIYFVIPFVIIFSTGTGMFSFIKNLFDENVSFSEAIAKVGIGFLIEFVWFLCSSIFYVIGKIKFAVTGRFIDFFKFTKNLSVGLNNIEEFFKLWMFSFFILAIVAIIDEILIVTAIGVILIPLFSILIYYFVSAYELGHLSCKVVTDVELSILKNKYQGFLKTEESPKNSQSAQRLKTLSYIDIIKFDQLKEERIISEKEFNFFKSKIIELKEFKTPICMDELFKLKNLKSVGVITEHELKFLKMQVINGDKFHFYDQLIQIHSIFGKGALTNDEYKKIKLEILEKEIPNFEHKIIYTDVL